MSTLSVNSYANALRVIIHIIQDSEFTETLPDKLCASNFSGGHVVHLSKEVVQSIATLSNFISTVVEKWKPSSDFPSHSTIYVEARSTIDNSKDIILSDKDFIEFITNYYNQHFIDSTHNSCETDKNISIQPIMQKELHMIVDVSNGAVESKTIHTIPLEEQDDIRFLNETKEVDTSLYSSRTITEALSDLRNNLLFSISDAFSSIID